MQEWCDFRVGGGGGNGTGGGVCCWACCEVSSVVYEWEGVLLCCFSLKLVEMTGLSVGGFLLGMVIWADCFSFWNVVSWARW